jgi:hypothetical protein
MKAPIRKSLRKWAVGVGCTLSVALLLQQAKDSDVYQIAHANADNSLSQSDNPSAAQDPVIQEWKNQTADELGSDSSGAGSSTDSSSGFNDPFAASPGNSGFHGRSSHS